MMNFSRRLALTCFGLVVFSVGIVLNLQADVGLGPWQAFHYGLTLHVPMSFGQASMVTGVVMVGLSWLLGVRPGLATALNVVIVGVCTDVILELRLIPSGSGGADSYLLLVSGIMVTGLGSALYVKGGLGAGPRDSFMLGLASYLGGRIGPARNAMDLTVTGLGWLMGAAIGPGTLVFAFGLGPTLSVWFRLLRVPVKRRPAPRKEPAVSG